MTTAVRLRGAGWGYEQIAEQQAGGAKGTQIAAAHAAPGITHLTYESAQHVSNEQHGSFFSNLRTFQGLKNGGVAHDTALFLEDAHHYLAHAITAKPVPTAAVGTTASPFFTYSPPAVPISTQGGTYSDLPTMTWEWRSDGSLAWYAPFATCNSLTISGNASQNTSVRLALQYIARARYALSTTFANPLGRTRSEVLPALTRVYIADTYAGLTTGPGATPLTVVGAWSWGVTNNLQPKYYCAGSYLWTDLERGARVPSLTLNMRCVGAGMTEYTNSGAEAGVSAKLRYVRIEIIGGTIPTFDPGVNYKLWLDMAGYWSVPNIGEDGETSVLPFTLMPVLATDITPNTDFQATLFTGATDLTVTSGGI